MLNQPVTMLEDEKLDEKREEFFKLYQEKLGIDPREKNEDNEQKKKVSINIFGIKANI